MSVSRARAWAYAETLLERPARRVEVTLRRGKGGLTLLHRGRALTRCYDTGVGRTTAELVARALGTELPPPGGSATAAVSTGVLFRAVSISSMDPRVEDIWPLFRRLLQEADEMRAAASESEEPGV